MTHLSTDLKSVDLSRRKQSIISMAAGSKQKPASIKYLPHEDRVWSLISGRLRPIWDKKVADEVLEARELIQLPTNHVPQLIEVSEKLAPISGFEFRAVGGLVPIDEFFGGLSDKKFMSTQYLRHPANPFYTDEPDIVHEVIGHGTLLADARLARLHQITGEALTRMKTKQAKQFIADLWWFTGEFGLVNSSQGVKAFGAGILSSVSELEHFTKGAQLLPFNIKKMATTKYRIDRPQDTLFVVESIDHLLSEMELFLKIASDESINDILKDNKQ
jgi:phenylalanine-4-hydroxylase